MVGTPASPNFEIDSIESDSPEKIWTKYKDVVGIDSESYRRYYHNKKQAVAIKIKRTTTFKIPIDPILYDVFKRPPQSFKYARLSLFNSIKDASAQP